MAPLIGLAIINPWLGLESLHPSVKNETLIVQGGVQNNVVPPELVVGFDCRLSVTTDLNSFENWIKEVCKKAGEGVYPEYQQKQNAKATTKLDSTNPFWGAFKSECDQLGIKLKLAIFPAGTDSRFIRDLGIPAFGFSPMNMTPVLLHDHDEYISEKTFLTGIDIYARVIPALANVSSGMNQEERTSATS